MCRLLFGNPFSKVAVSMLPVYRSREKINIIIGLAEIAYVPPQIPMSREEWPTLKEMLDSTKRVVMFMDRGAEDGTVPYLIRVHPTRNTNKNSEQSETTNSTKSPDDARRYCGDA